jgi:phage terminase small subunit
VTAKLTDKQRRFVEEYLVDLNATQAALRAGYSQRTAASIGNENLTKPLIRASIEKELAKLRERSEVTVESIIQRLNTIADRCMPKQGKPSASQAQAANRALELLGKHLGMFINRVEVLERLRNQERTRLFAALEEASVTVEQAEAIQRVLEAGAN